MARSNRFGFTAKGSKGSPMDLKFPLLAHQVVEVLFVFVADRLQQLATAIQLRVNRNRPWSGIRLGIVERELNIHVPKVAAAEAFGHMQGFRMRVAAEIKPRFIVKARRFDHERVALPMTDRISHI